MNNVVSLHAPSQEQFDRLKAEVMALPQIEPVTEHFFVPGMYCRRVFRKAGTLVVGKVHKFPHFYVCAAGEIVVIGIGKERVTLRAGDVIECQPGTQRMTCAMEDSVGITIHKTDKTDIAELEAELVEDDPDSMYLPGNKLKELLLKVAS